MKRQKSSTCRFCGKDFFCARKQTFCSKACYAASCRKRTNKRCEWCGVTFLPTHGTRRAGRFCTKHHAFRKSRCRNLFAAIQQRFLSTLKAAARASAAIERERQKRIPRTVECMACNVAFELTPPAKQKMCGECRKASIKRGRKRAKHVRRARMKGCYAESFDRQVVFERDGWMCMICNQPCDKMASVPHPLAATLDHIVPLAKGGPHTMQNTQCAHFKCNYEKADAMPNINMHHMLPQSMMGVSGTIASTDANASAARHA